ncbi:MAG TPA: SDR family NAD(P)-dependent oxidoreductase, partial [Candidatus Ozemobacteraceae bacterium]|nr:SDR family NAD(P)-dependent oxidoreductase [Candidatus Ozemobacteraceae bacterium]
ASQLLGLVVAQGAMVDAGYGPKREFDRSKVSIVLGLTGTLQLVIPLGARLGHPVWRKALKDAGVADDIAAEVMANIGEAYVPWQENSFPGLLGNVAAGRIANRLNLGGTNCIVDAACGSSLGAVHLAAMEVLSGASDMAITGGVDMFNDIFMYMCFSKTPALSASGDAKPFSTDADGTSLGEGVGMVILKRLDKAKADGDKIYALLKGVGTSSDVRGKAIYAPSDEGQEKALRRAYENAGASPDTIGLLEAHGTGTKVGDEIELKALRRVYGDAPEGRPWCGIGSVKSMIGHTKAAAGSAGLIKGVMALYTRTLPPTIKVKEPAPVFRDPKSPFYLLLEKRPWFNTSAHPRRAAISAFGFGGSNYHAILEEYEQDVREIDWDGRAEIVAISGGTPAAVKSALAPFKKAAATAELSNLAAQSRRDFQAAHACRLVFVVEPGKSDVAALTASVEAKLSTTPLPERFTLPEGVWYETGTAAAPIGIVFPGQGAQYIDMGRDLCCMIPETFESIAKADATLGELANGRRLGDLTYPPAAFDEDAKKAQEDTLRNTSVAQPAIGAVSIGSFRALEKFGIRPAAMIGHSFGELTALCAAGAYDEETLFRLARRRGELMATGTGDRGGMIAVSLSAEEAAKAIADEKLDLIIANYNAPAQMVLSGSTTEIQRAAALFKSRKIRATVLQVAGAFHSKFVADASIPFKAAVREASIKPPATPVYANTTGLPYPADAASIIDLLGNQLANPVKFIAGIEAMYAAGVRTFVEVAPGAKMSGLVKSILGDRPFNSIGIDAGAGKRPGSVDLARTVAMCAALGHPVRLTLWEDGENTLARAASAKKPAMAIQLCGANYRTPRPPRIKKPVPAKPAAAAIPAPVAPAASPVPPAASVAAPKPHPASPALRTASSPSPRPAQISSGANMPDDASLRMARDTMMALQQMQVQTAELHRKFLEGQEQAQKTLQQLIEAQAGRPGPQVATAQPASVAVQPMQTARPPHPAPVLQPTASTSEAAAGVSIRQTIPAHAATPPAREMKKPVQAVAPQTDVSSVLMAVVSEKTGYPAEMLNLDMDMESDLGIDSIKRVEIMSGVQEKLPAAPVIQPDQLGKLRTLRQIIAFLTGSASAASDMQSPGETAPLHIAAQPTAGFGQPAQSVTAQQQAQPSACFPDVLHRTVVEAVAQVPAANRPVIALPPDSTILITDDGTPLTGFIAAELAIRGAKPEIIHASIPLYPAKEAKISGLILLAPQPRTTSDGRWQEESETFAKQAFQLAQASGASLLSQSAKGTTLFATISRMDGAFGLIGPESGMDPLQGALAGLAKTAAREWPQVAVKAIDLDSALPPDAATAKLLADELFTRGPIESGITAETRYVLVETEEPIRQKPDAKPVWQSNDIVLVTGGARGVTAAVAIEIARAGGPTLVLLGRSPEPQPEPAWLTGLTFEADIKRSLMMHADGRKLTPKEIEKQYQHVIANREIIRTMKAIEAAGGHHMYRSVDIRKADAVALCIAGIQRTTGRITGLVHGAGVLRDRKIAEKTRDQFDDVFDTKIVGLRNVLTALAGESLKGLVLFSSVTARYGRIGQVDYAMANEALNKIAQQWAQMHPECRTIACNWGPWDGGMVNEGLRKLFIEEGVGLIPLEAGAKHLVAELSNAAENQIEVVIIGMEGLPLRGQPQTDEGGILSGAAAAAEKAGTAAGSLPAVAQTVEVRLAVSQSGARLNPSAPAATSLSAPTVSKPATADLVSAPSDQTPGEAPAALRKKFIPAFERLISLEKDRYLAAHILNGD